MHPNMLDGLSEEDKSRAFVNDDKTAFVAAEVKKSIKVRDVELYSRNIPILPKRKRL